MLEKIKSFGAQCIRVWHLLKKPSTQEWTTIAKVSAIGLAIIGVLGFIISLFMTFFGLNM